MICASGSSERIFYLPKTLHSSRASPDPVGAPMSAILGPIATLAAAVAASFITWRFASQQARTAKQQVDTALDQLRYNLFEKRYAIYSTAKEMIKYIVNQGSANDVDASFRIAQYFNALDEARFFLPDDICQWLHTLRHDHCEKLLVARSRSSRSSTGRNLVSDEPPRRTARRNAVALREGASISSAYTEALIFQIRLCAFDM